MNSLQIILLGLAGSFAAGAMTAVGSIPVLFNWSMSQRTHDASLGLAAGVMLAASFFSLIIPGLEVAEQMTRSVTLSALIVVVGLVLGVGAIALLNERIPHAHFVQGRQGPMSPSLQKVWLFVLAITIHNFPEGLAVGGLLGVLAVTVSQQLLPWGLAFAAGAMIYVIVHEIIPEIHSRAFTNDATAGLTAGLAVMMFLDVTLG